VDRGFSLIEVLVAMMVTTVATVALAQLSVISMRANYVARATTFTTVLAAQKMEQLRALAWASDPSGAEMSDTSTDTTVVPERSSGGTGLSPSPADALVTNTPGYCDFLDANGRTLGGGSTPPANTAYIRRWAIEPLQVPGNDALAFQVRVTPIATRVTGPHGRTPSEARLFGIKARKGT
jgi:prepilin-type N-terminal cleavage/methylation domain-containing protein